MISELGISEISADLLSESERKVRKLIISELGISEIPSIYFRNPKVIKHTLSFRVFWP